jgi:hypothetical protein
VTAAADPANRGVTDVTLGEVSRNLVKLETSVTSLADRLGTLHDDIRRETETQIVKGTEVLQSRVDRLEKIVYTAAGFILLSFLTGLAALVFNATGSGAGGGGG